MEFVLASGNRGKLVEIEAIWSGTGLALLPQSDFGVSPPEETAATFVENALIKARHASACTARPAIADDSGLCVAALDGAPGVRSARFAGRHANDADNIERLLDAMTGVPDEARGAVFVCVAVALSGPADSDPVLAAGRWQGHIARRRSGTRGFGYDPVFVDAATGRTAAMLGDAAKNAVSHRGAAFTELLRQMSARGLADAVR